MRISFETNFISKRNGKEIIFWFLIGDISNDICSKINEDNNVKLTFHHIVLVCNLINKGMVKYVVTNFKDIYGRVSNIPLLKYEFCFMWIDMMKVFIVLHSSYEIDNFSNKFPLTFFNLFIFTYCFNFCYSLFLSLPAVSIKLERTPSSYYK